MKKNKKNKMLIINMFLIVGITTFVTLNQYFAQSIQIKEANYIYKGNEVLTIDDTEEKTENLSQKIENYKNPSISIEEEKTLLQYNAKPEELEIIENDVEEMQQGIILKIDDLEYYAENKKIIDETKDLLYQTLIKDEKVLEKYKQIKQLNDYVYDNKNISMINIENEITIEEGFVPQKEMISTSSELIYNLLHQQNYDQRQTYIVSENETFESLLKKTNQNEIEFYFNNPQYKGIPVLIPGEEIITDEIEPKIKIAVYYEEGIEKIIKYDKITKKTTDLDYGEKKIEQKGQNGKQKIKYSNKIVNGKIVHQSMISQEILVEPQNEIILEGKLENSSEDTTVSTDSNTGGFIWPMDSHNVTCIMGCYAGHNGTDIQGGYGSSIYASADGTVATAGWSPYGGGYEVTINHGGGVYTVYSHMKQQPNVSAGQSVSQGTVLGYMGGTGNVTGPHLHFEIRLGCSSGAFSGTPVSALSYI